MQALLIFSLLSASSASHITRRLPSLCCGWHASTAANMEQSNWLKFSFAVKEQNMDLIRQAVDDVSDPRSESYGKYLSTEEIDEMTKPLSSDVEIVTKWLSAHNIFFLVELDGRKVSVECSVAQAESLLRTSIRTLTNKKTNQKVVKALGEYSLPSAVHQVFAD